MARGDMSDKEWQEIAALLPPEHPHRRGRPYVEHRHVLNGILWIARTGAPWRDLPERYGPWQTCYDRFRRWERSGIWMQILEKTIAERDARGEVVWVDCALDGSYIKAHPDAAGARHRPSKADDECAKRGAKTPRPSQSCWTPRSPVKRRWATAEGD